jgi:hypothetical protein
MGKPFENNPVDQKQPNSDRERFPVFRDFEGLCGTIRDVPEVT